MVFARRADALAAVKRYNNVLLDGKPMKIEIIGTNIPTQAVVPRFTNGAFGSTNGSSKRFAMFLLLEMHLRFILIFLFD